MANTKISALTAATTPLAGTEVLPIVQSGVTKQVSVANLTAGRAVSASSLSSTTKVSAKIATSATYYRVYEILATGGTAIAEISYNDTNDTMRIANLSNYVNTSMTFYVNAADRMEIMPNGDIKALNGNIIPSTAAKGINFTANTAAAGKTSQLLNWYEEGTWTPTLTPSTSGSITLTSPTNSMRYTRVGRLVTLTGPIDVASVSSPVGDLRLTGIPFNVGGSGAGSVSVYGLGTTSTATAYQVLVDSGNTTTVFIRGYNAGNQVATVANNVQSGSGFYLTIQYIV